MSATAIVRLTFFLLYVVALSYRGLRARPGLFSWHMFAGVQRCQFKLVESSEGTQTSFNPWHYLHHSYYSMGFHEMKLFLFYLQQVHGLRLDGDVILTKGRKRSSVKVRNTSVAD